MTLVGCQTNMVNRNNPYADYNYDFASCENEAMRRVPVAAPANPGSYSTNCNRSGNDMSCKSTAEASTYDPQRQTSFDRNAYTSNCLKLKGWIDEPTSSTTRTQSSRNVPKEITFEPSLQDPKIFDAYDAQRKKCDPLPSSVAFLKCMNEIRVKK